MVVIVTAFKVLDSTETANRWTQEVPHTHTMLMAIQQNTHIKARRLTNNYVANISNGQIHAFLNLEPTDGQLASHR